MSMDWKRHVGWDPRSIDWRVPMFFIVGATCFAVGSLPSYAIRVPPLAVGITFFVGSIFFTLAGATQLIQLRRNYAAAGNGISVRRWHAAIEHGSFVWWAAAIQFIGMLFFNISTFDAMASDLSVQQVNRLVWTPDLLGSIAFLVASHLAWLAACGRRLWIVLTEDEDWWIAAFAYLGSIFFMLSAIGAFTLDTDAVINQVLVNAGTFIGALFFIAAAYPLLPETGENPRPPVGT